MILQVFMLLAACQKSNFDSGTGQVRVIKRYSSVSDEGILYEDSKTFTRKCYYDFQSMKNAYFCTKPNCNHTDIGCTSKINRPYTFLIGGKQYYIETQTEMDKDSKESVVSYLYKSDISDSDTRNITKFEGLTLSDIYLVDNVLYMLVLRPEIKDGISTSYGKYDIYQIDMKNYSVKKTFVREGDNIGYMAMGCIDQKLILYYRYMEKEVDPEDFGSIGRMQEFILDTENYKTYMEEVMKVFHEGMCYFDLRSKEIVNIDLPTPVYLHKNTYYYNKKSEVGLYQLVAQDFSTQEEVLIYDGPIRYITAIGDILFIKEGYETISETTFQPIIAYDRNKCKEYVYNLITNEIQEVIDNSSEEADFELIAEYGEYYVLFYTNPKEGIIRRIGYMLKEDYYSGKEKITLVDPI